MPSKNMSDVELRVWIRGTDEDGKPRGNREPTVAEVIEWLRNKLGLTSKSEVMRAVHQRRVVSDE